MQCSGFRAHSYQEFGINDETIELVGGTLGVDDHTTSRISAKSWPKVQQGREEKGV